MRRLRFAPIVVLAAAAIAAGSAGASDAACSGVDVAVTSQNASAARAAVRCLVNAQRAAHGLPALHADALLDRVAAARSAFMVDNQAFGHDDPSGGAASRARAAGYTWSFVAENIASGQTTPRDVMAGWMASDGHCRNILSPSVADVGIGVVAGGAGPGLRGATWTEVFGRRSSDAAPDASSSPASGCPYHALVTDSLRASTPRATQISVHATRSSRSITVRGRVRPARAGIPIAVTLRRASGPRTSSTTTQRDGSFVVRIGTTATSARVTIATPGLSRLTL